MPNVTIRIPMVADVGPLQHRQMSRDFQGALPSFGSVSFLARIIRDGLESGNYPEHKRLIELPDDWLVQQIALVKAVPDDVWIRNGFVPLDDWKQSHDG